ncbi:hypothetical protein Tco_0519580 [Tanacetum coccineum]
MEYLVKVSKKARILELKRRNIKITDSDIQYAVSIKEDMVYSCLNLTKDHKGNKINMMYREEGYTPYSRYRRYTARESVVFGIIEEKKKNDDEEAGYDESRRRTVRYSANYDSDFE